MIILVPSYRISPRNEQDDVKKFPAQDVTHPFLVFPTLNVNYSGARMKPGILLYPLPCLAYIESIIVDSQLVVIWYVVFLLGWGL